MTTALVFGPYPPMPGPTSERTLAAVRALLAGGAEVTVVSPRPSGAHHHAHPAGLGGALRLARWISGAERAVLFADPEMLCGAVGGGRLARGLPGAAGLPPGRAALA
ncbi:MAG: hypothetical protein ACRDY7_07560, partial [Acidimicrobiia bacterium]